MRERGEGARERAKVRCRRQLSDQFVDGSRCKKRCAVARDAHRLSKLVALPVSLRFLSAVSLSLSRSLSKTPLSPSLSPPQLPNLPHSTHHFREPRRALARRSPPETSPAPSGWRTAGSPSSWPVRSLFFFFFFFFWWTGETVLLFSVLLYFSYSTYSISQQILPSSGSPVSTWSSCGLLITTSLAEI